MLSLDNDSDTFGIKNFHQRGRDLFGHTFLDLQTAGEHIHDPGDFAQTQDLFLGNVTDVAFAEKRQHVMFAKAEKEPALIPVIPCVDTMKLLETKTEPGRGEVLVTMEGQSVDRSYLFGAQTPQIFHSEVLKPAYDQAFDTSFTDDASVVLKYGKNLSYLIGERFNIKITTQDDLVLAKAILSLSCSS